MRRVKVLGWLSAAVILASSGWGCSWGESSKPDGGFDAGADGGFDAGVDGSADAGADREVDAGGDDRPDPCLNFDQLVSQDALFGHLQQLFDVSTQNGGTRAAGTPGYQESMIYVESQLQAAGYTPWREPVDFHHFWVWSEGALAVTAPTQRTFRAANDWWDPARDSRGEFSVALFSPPGDVTAELAAVDLDMRPGNQSTSGCQAADFDDGQGGSLVDGKIALIQTGSCYFYYKVSNAQAAGALGVILFAQGDTNANKGLFLPDLTPTWDPGHDLTIPAVYATYVVAEELVDLMDGDPVQIRLEADTYWEIGQTQNLFAEAPGASSQVLMLGAHLDSEITGPGMNDNASGATGVLEIALQLSHCTPSRTVRFAWWGAEEGGRWGSITYLDGLSNAERARIRGYLNLDLIASRNYVYQVGDGDGSLTGQPAPDTSGELEAFFHQDFAEQELPLLEAAFMWNSDYVRFLEYGIGVGNLDTGGHQIKTTAWQNLFGGTAGQPCDPCLHKPCDDIYNTNPYALRNVSRALARAVQHFGIEGQGL